MTPLEYKTYLEDTPKYNTAQEKNAMVKAIDSESTPIDIAKELGLNPTNESEAVAMIFQARKKSVGEHIEVVSDCDCGFKNINQVLIDDLFFKNMEDIDKSVNIKLYDDITEIEDFDDNELENINKIEKIIMNNNNLIFSNIINITCKRCGNNYKIKINYKDIISKFTVKNIFEQYIDISTITNMTKMDIDSMIPFEREIFISIIEEKQKKQQTQ